MVLFEASQHSQVSYAYLKRREFNGEISFIHPFAEPFRSISRHRFARGSTKDDEKQSPSILVPMRREGYRAIKR
ncbi:hypothetical protein ACNKHM_10820 [Shigella sonnei]